MEIFLVCILIVNFYYTDFHLLWVGLELNPNDVEGTTVLCIITD